MPTNPFDHLQKQISEQFYKFVNPAPENLNPKYSKEKVSQFTNVNNIPPSSASASYGWTVRQTKSTVSNPGAMDATVFDKAGSILDIGTIQSMDGNLSIGSLTPGKIYAFSCIITRYSAQINTLINIPWSSNISVILNGKILTQSSTNAQSTLPINLVQGQNALDIYLYASQSSTFFTINSPLATYADKWDLPSFKDPSSLPKNLIVTPVQSPANVTIYNNNLKWDNNTDGHTYGYRVYRRGPSANIPFTGKLFLHGSPVNSGNFGNGQNGLSENQSYYYAISLYGLNGNGSVTPAETTATLDTSFASLGPPASGVWIGTKDPKISSFSVEAFNDGKNLGSLGNTNYLYGITVWGNNNYQETPIAASTTLNPTPQKQTKITWTPLDQAFLTGNYGWYGASGYRLYRSNTLVFNNLSFVSNNLIATITGLYNNTWVDSGNLPALSPAPPSKSQVMSGLGIMLTWNNSFGGYLGIFDNYYIYRSSKQDFTGNTLVAKIPVSQLRSYYANGKTSFAKDPVLDYTGHRFNLFNFGGVGVGPLVGNFNLTNGFVASEIFENRFAIGPIQVGQRLENTGPFGNSRDLPAEISTWNNWAFSFDVFLSGAPTTTFDGQWDIMGCANSTINPTLEFTILPNLSLRCIGSDGTNTNTVTTSSAVIATGYWNTLMFDYYNGTSNIYVNGIKKATTVKTLKTPILSNVVRVGCRSYGSYPMKSGFLSNINMLNLSNPVPVQTVERAWFGFNVSSAYPWRNAGFDFDGNFFLFNTGFTPVSKCIPQCTTQGVPSNVAGRVCVGPFITGQYLENAGALPHEISQYDNWNFQMDILLSGKPDTRQTMLGAGTSTQKPTFRFDINSDLSISYLISGYTLQTAANIINTGCWNSLSFTYKNGVSNLYVSGVSKASLSQNIPPQYTTILRVGSDQDGKFVLASGYLSNFKILTDRYEPDTSTITSFFDSGYATKNQSPILWNNVADLTYPTNTYVDQSVLPNWKYDYVISSYNYLLIENLGMSNSRSLIG